MKLMIRILNKLWEYKVKSRAGFACEICGAVDNGLDAAHIIPRTYIWTRHDMRNGVAACKGCHNHKTIMAWLADTDPGRLAWVMTEKAATHPGQKLDYDQIYEKLDAA